MRCRDWSLLLLVLALLTPSLARADSPPEVDPPEDWVARMFMKSGAKVQNPDGKDMVYPLKRKGEWGYAEHIMRKKVGRFYVLSFELVLAKIKKKDVPQLIATQSAQGKPVRRVVAVVLLDEKGFFRAKPEGFPLERVDGPGCMDLDCSSSLLSLSNLTVGDDEDGVAILKYENDFKTHLIALQIAETAEGGHALHASKPLTLGSNVAPCGPYLELKATAVQGEGNVQAMLLHQCDPEGCGDECDTLKAEKKYTKWPAPVTQAFEFPTM